ncbi:MAG: TM2 domain-containing protein [Oscillospiraceae bacterium]|nr:TM2 domain-containing protein [Oscillospiraceae bacterium]MBQ9938269.1 TM2 domain-containing protein [Oscillospiraceae bacterium]
MDCQKVDMFMATNGKYFPEEQLYSIREHLLRVEDDKFSIISALDYKDPTVSLIISLFLGYLGIDRFIIGDIGMGIGKLLTGGGCGIWSIVDWFIIMKATKEKNLQKLATYL